MLNIPQELKITSATPKELKVLKLKIMDSIKELVKQMLTNCKISTAKSAGFCFGVDRAVKIVYNSLNTHNKVVTLGPIIHNPDVVADLE